MTDSSHRLAARLSPGEAVALALCAALTATIVTSAFWARVGVLVPAGVLVIAVAAFAATPVWLMRSSTRVRDRALLTGAGVTFTAAAACLAYFAWPSMLPPGRGWELTHHLMLIDFIERTWRLPDATLAGAMQEMATAPPGLHLVASLLGSWIGRDGFSAVYFVVAFAVALKLTVVYFIAAREFADSGSRIPLAAVGTLLCLLPSGFVLRSFVHDSSLARVAAELFVAGMWWAVVVWDAHPSRTVAALFALLGAGAFLTWPASVGPPVVTLVAVMATARHGTARERFEQLILALAPIGLSAMLHLAAGGGWRVSTGPAGQPLQSPFDAFAVLLFATGALGIVAAAVSGRFRVTLLLALSTLMFALTAFVVQSGRGGVPAAALEMVAAAIYPLAVLGAGALGLVIERRTRRLAPRAAAWMLALVTAAVAGVSLARFPMPQPIVSRDLYQAGRWVRANLDPACVDYLVPEPDTMYWLHVAVLGNARSSLRTANPAAFDPEQARQRWLEPAGLPFAIGSVPEIPREILESVDVLEQFGTAAVISRRGPSTCADAQRLAAGGEPTRYPPARF